MKRRRISLYIKPEKKYTAGYEKKFDNSAMKVFFMKSSMLKKYTTSIQGELNNMQKKIITE